MNAQAETTATPDDANDLRGLHFKLLLGKAITWIAIADSRSEDSFFEAYAAQRGLSLAGRSHRAKKLRSD
jgi:hypothetical protein